VHVLFIAGDELLGAKQNRIWSAPVLIDALETREADQPTDAADSLWRHGWMRVAVKPLQHARDGDAIRQALPTRRWAVRCL
jgi:hypothetical protein